MFVKCSKRVRFTNPDNAKVSWEMPAGFIGDIPSWVEKHWYFEACCKDGIITAIKSKSDRDIQNAIDSKPQEAEDASADSLNNELEAEDESKPSKQPGAKKDSGGKK